MCPVSGEPLGAHGKPVEVQVAVPNLRPPTFLERIGLKKRPATELVPIYVCSPECAQRMKNDKNPENYLIHVIAERGGSAP